MFCCKGKDSSLTGVHVWCQNLVLKIRSWCCDSFWMLKCYMLHLNLSSCERHAASLHWSLSASLFLSLILMTDWNNDASTVQRQRPTFCVRRAWTTWFATLKRHESKIRKESEMPETYHEPGFYWVDPELSAGLWDAERETVNENDPEQTPSERI